MKYLLLTVTVLYVATAGFAQKIQTEKVPVVVKAAFAKYFPSVKTVKWEMENQDYEAGFTITGKSMSALFQPDGSLKESEEAIKPAILPQSALEYIKTNYKGKKITEAAKISKAGGEINYEAEINGSDVIFDAGGKFIREVKSNP